MEGLDKIIGHAEIHSFSAEKQELLSLEAEGKYVFHGSDTEFEFAEPRQAIDTVEEGKPDRLPAIFASSKVDYAIFRSFFYEKRFPGVICHIGTTTHDDGSVALTFGLLTVVLDALKQPAERWVYVFNKEDFKLIGERVVEYERDSPLKPVKKIKISERDLPSIEIFEP